MLNIEDEDVAYIVEKIKRTYNSSSDGTTKIPYIKDNKSYDIVVTAYACHLPAFFVNYIGEGTLGIFGSMVYNSNEFHIIKQRNGDYTLLTNDTIVDYNSLNSSDHKELFTFKADGLLDGTLVVSGIPVTNYKLDGAKVILEDQAVRYLMPYTQLLLNNAAFDNLRQYMYVRLHSELALLVMEDAKQESTKHHMPNVPNADHRLRLYDRWFDISFTRARDCRRLFTTLDSTYKLATGVEASNFIAVMTDDDSNVDSLDTVLDSAVLCELLCAKRATLGNKSGFESYAIMFDGSRIGTFGVTDKKIVLEVVPENLFSTEDGFVNFIKASLGV